MTTEAVHESVGWIEREMQVDGFVWAMFESFGPWHIYDGDKCLCGLDGRTVHENHPDGGDRTLVVCEDCVSNSEYYE